MYDGEFVRISNLTQPVTDALLCTVLPVITDTYIHYFFVFECFMHDT